MSLAVYKEVKLAVYCIYSNQVISNADTSREHIIPLSMGGMDGFEIPVGKEINKKNWLKNRWKSVK